MKKICVIIPCYNEEQTINIYYETMQSIIKKIKAKFEMLFVDDGSTDNTLKIITELARKDKNVKYISFSRNFGKEAAMYAGLENSTGDYTVIMDVDLQDPPELILEMYKIIETGEYDCVASRRVNRKGEAKIKSILAKNYYKLINKISDTQIVDGARDYRMMTRQMVDSILTLKEYNRFSKGIFSWVGYKTKWLEFENKNRIAGETKWSLGKLFIYSLESIVDFSTVLLKLSSVIGLIFCLIAFIMIFVIIIKKWLFGDPVAGWPSLTCIIFLVSGVQLFCLGIIGKYLANTYSEVKKRPIYIAKYNTVKK